ncbi:LysE family translocator [Agrobacterium larrymoorei]|uniref:LysE family translocator n=1 Tax=Agrobacterium larrymoorei TaxID=160699 RepID=A0AAF0HCF6_9HYPH|nr:LysE family translocator [Agrobacterium larrymoorei]WHA41844.1 LysE family translocator [Agrobacterium larrymoorei]
MLDLHQLLIVYIAYIIAVASPGPSNMTIMGVAMSQGRAPAIVLALGVMTGSLCWATVAATGLSAVLATFANALFVIKIAGGFYLLYLAYKSARSAFAKVPQAEPGALATSRADYIKLYRRGLLLHLTNPKAVLGWLAIMSLGLKPGAGPATLAAIIGGCAILGLTIFCGYALLFSTAPAIRIYQKAKRSIEVTLALFFGFAGIKLLLSRV